MRADAMTVHLRRCEKDVSSRRVQRTNDRGRMMRSRCQTLRLIPHHEVRQLEAASVSRFQKQSVQSKRARKYAPFPSLTTNSIGSDHRTWRRERDWERRRDGRLRRWELFELVMLRSRRRAGVEGTTSWSSSSAWRRSRDRERLRVLRGSAGGV